MCGIIGFAGKTEAVPILLDGLERLEYRGYDSAGVAVVSADGRLQVKKSKGRLSVLRELLESQAPLSGNIGIGHTRWATHGEPNDTNAHPHVGQEGKIAVVHNGIIENYLEIKNSLIRKGVVFSSDTDTEVIVQLLEYYYRKKSNLMYAVYAVLNRIKGAYAMGILCSDFPGQMVLLLMLGACLAKQLNRIDQEEYAAGELKHGTISLIEPGTLVVALATYEPLVEKSLSNIVEVKSRGAEVIAMTTELTVSQIGSQASEMFVIPKTHSFLQPILGVIPLQLFAYYVALNRGCDIDKPRNLAKAVTVE